MLAFQEEEDQRTRRCFNLAAAAALCMAQTDFSLCDFWPIEMDFCRSKSLKWCTKGKIFKVFPFFANFHKFSIKFPLF